MKHTTRRLVAALWLGLALAGGASAQAQSSMPGDAATHDGLIKVRRAYSVDETVARIRKDIAD